MNTTCSSAPPRFDRLPAGCPDCGFLQWARHASLTAGESSRFANHIEHRRPRRPREFVHRAGTALTSLYVINSGFLRTSVIDGGGREQITGFAMPGDLVGMEAIATGRHQCNTIAIEQSSICGIAFADFEQLNLDIPALQHHFHQTMGAEIVRDHGMMLLLGAMHADERVAMFLLQISRRLEAHGHAGNRFRLPMARHEIGNYLGLKLETVSRAFSQLRDAGLISVDSKAVVILDPEGLKALIRNRC
jgi:CRP/FNR family transcriptional regulator